jgi:hypothetical protein
MSPDTRSNLDIVRNAETNSNNRATSSGNHHQQSGGPKSVVQSRLPPSPPPPVPDTDIDDAYNFPSEDDSFLAEFDFAELEADLGRPIDHDGGMTTEQGRMQINTIERSCSGDGGVNKQKTKPGTSAETVETISTSKSHDVQQHGPLNSRQAATRTPDNFSVQDQNNNSGVQQRVNSGGPGAKLQQNASSRFSTGGFNVPPGLVSYLSFFFHHFLLRVTRQNPQRQSSSGAAQNTNAGAQRWNGATGLKRTVDAMHQQYVTLSPRSILLTEFTILLRLPAPGPRKVAQGMGLSNGLNASTSNSSTRREPLTSIYVDPGTSVGPDAKRMKF